MNRELNELIELKQYVDNLVEQVINEKVKSSKITKAGHIAQTLSAIPLSVGGIAGYLKRKETDEKILEYLRNNPDTTIEDVKELRDKARKKQRKREMIGSVVQGGLAGTLMGPGPGNVLGAAGGYLGQTVAHGVGDIIRATKTGQRSELDTNKRFLKAAAEERKAGITTKHNKQKLENLKF